MRSRGMISLIGPLIMLVAGSGFALGAVATLDLGSFRRMGPGAFPLLVGGLLAVLAAIGVVQGLRQPETALRPDPVAVFGVVAGVMGFAIFTPLAGVLPATGLAVFATSTAIPGVRWSHRLILALAVSIAVWLIFVVGLGMPFVAIRGM